VVKSKRRNGSPFVKFSVPIQQIVGKIMFYFPFAFIACLIAMKLISQESYWNIMAAEDGPAESATSIVYLIAMFVAIWIATSFRKSQQNKYAILYTVLALVLFVIAMEEISWGQRFFGIKSSGIFETYNHQSETNIHNFLSRRPLHMVYILVSSYGAFAWKWFPKKWQIQYPVLSKLVVPDRKLLWYFLPTTVLYIYYDYLGPILVKGFGIKAAQALDSSSGYLLLKDQEPIELLLSMGFMCFMIMIVYRQAHNLFRLSIQHKF
jgi:hypothetical protein